MIKQLFVMLVLLCVGVSSVSAATLQLNVSGQVATMFPPAGDGTGGYFSASILFDSDTPDGEQQDEDRGAYASSLGLGVLVYDGVTYTEIGGPNSIIVQNNNATFGFGTDSFFYNGFFISESGVVIDFGLQFIDTSNTVFSDDSHPGSLDLEQFDAFDASDPFNGTYAALFFLDPNMNAVFGPMDSAQLRPVPIPAAIVLFISGIGLLCGVSRKHR